MQNHKVTRAEESYKKVLVARAAVKKAVREEEQQKANWRKNERERIRHEIEQLSREIKANIQSIFEREWAPKIDTAAGSGKRRVVICLAHIGRFGCYPEKEATVKYGVPLLRRLGYKVKVEKSEHKHRERDGDWIENCFELTVTW